MKILLTSERGFEFWDYCRSHSQLLIRSPRFRGKYDFNLDITFTAVDEIHSVSGFLGLTILEPSAEERATTPSLIPFANEPKNMARLFVLQSGEKQSFIRAHFINITETDLDFSVTSLKGMGKPQIV